jgi:hypothetical protein
MKAKQINLNEAGLYELPTLCNEAGMVLAWRCPPGVARRLPVAGSLVSI